MSRRTIVSLTASAIIAIACIATVSTDAFAYRRGVGVGRVGVHHGGVYRGGVYRGAAVRRGVAVGVGAAERYVPLLPVPYVSVELPTVLPVRLPTAS
jgi:hypothetical protein